MTATAARAVTEHRLASPASAPALRWGVIGAGWIADRFASAVTRHTASSIYGIASRDAHRARMFARTFGATAVRYGEGAYERLVDDPQVDAIYIATPHAMHLEHALLAIYAGKPVLVEKAFARNLAEATQIIEAANRHHVFVMEAMWTRFLPHMVEARRMIADGYLGDVVHVSADFGASPEYDPQSRAFDPDLAGGALLDLGVYPINLIHDVLGAPSTVRAIGALAPTGVDIRETVILDYPDRKAMGTAMSTFEVDTARLATITGTSGRIDFSHDYYGPASFTLTREGRRSFTCEPAVELGWQYQAAEVARCVAAGRIESTVMPHSATLEVMAILDQARHQLGVRYPGE